MSKPPLWEVMRAAYDCSTAANGSTDDWTERDGFAAEIRALRDWLVPEEVPPLGPAGKAHMQLRALLTAEADRAEQQP